MGWFAESILSSFQVLNYLEENNVVKTEWLAKSHNSIVGNH